MENSMKSSINKSNMKSNWKGLLKFSLAWQDIIFSLLVFVLGSIEMITGIFFVDGRFPLLAQGAFFLVWGFIISRLFQTPRNVMMFFALPVSGKSFLKERIITLVGIMFFTSLTIIGILLVAHLHAPIKDFTLVIRGILFFIPIYYLFIFFLEVISIKNRTRDIVIQQVLFWLSFMILISLNSLVSSIQFTSIKFVVSKISLFLSTNGLLLFAGTYTVLAFLFYLLCKWGVERFNEAQYNASSMLQQRFYNIKN